MNRYRASIIAGMFPATLELCKSGDYVKFSDYEQLRNENKSIVKIASALNVNPSLLPTLLNVESRENSFLDKEDPYVDAIKIDSLDRFTVDGDVFIVESSFPDGNTLFLYNSNLEIIRDENETIAKAKESILDYYGSSELSFYEFN